MSQIKTENELNINGVRVAVGEIRKLVARQKRYSIYFSWIHRRVHIVPEGRRPDPDWLLMESDIPWAYDQERLIALCNKFLMELEKKIRA